MSTTGWTRGAARLRVGKTPLLVLSGVMLLLLIGLTITSAQVQQTCRDVNNITVCGDQITESPTINGGGFRLRGNVKLGPKGQPAVVQVDNIGSIFDGSVLDPNVSTATFFHFSQPDPNTGTTDFLIGDVRMIADPTGLGLMAVSAVAVPGGSGEVRVGRLFVDTINRKIFNPAAGAVPIFVQDGITRNANVNLRFLSRVGALSFYRDGGSVNELSLVNGEFDLTAKTFKGVVPIDLKFDQQAENPTLRITMRATFSANGTFSGSVDGFKAALAGLILDISGVAVTPATASVPASFQAGLVKVLKADNQGVPTLDPLDPTLIFSFTNLKYKDRKFEIGGAEVPINPWEFGNAFKMTNQSLGLTNANGVQALQIKSTLAFFGDEADPKRKVPIILSVGRSEVSPGVFKPVFAAGLQNIEPKIGTLTFKLQGAVFSGSAAENFWGLKATTAAVQWPPYLGGQTAAGVNNFKFGIELDANANKKLKVALGSGTISLPPFENKVFRGTLGATIGTISNTLAITGTGTFTVILPNSGNSAGVDVTAKLRYGKGVGATNPPPPPGPLRCFRLGAVVPCPPGAGTPPPSGPVTEFDLALAGFNVKIAGFGLTVTNPRGLPDGGFAADNVAASLPSGIAFDNVGGGGDTNGITIQGLSVLGGGGIQIQGGGFQIAPIKFGGYQFVGLKGTFVQLPGGGFEFKAGGKLPLPGIEPGANGGGIGVEVRIRTKPDNSVDGFGLTVEFTSGGPIPKIKLPGTGMSIATVSGSFDLNAGTATIQIAMKATSDLAIPLGSLGSLPIVTVNGSLVVQAPPAFKMTANASLSILVFQVAQASIGIGQGYGFNGGAGLDVALTIDTLFVDGSAHLKVGQVTLSDGTQKIRVQGDASLSVTIPEKIFAGLPRDPKPLASISVGFGQYKDTNTNKQSAGLLAMGTLNLIGTVGGFLDMGASPVDLIFFKDPNRFQPVPRALLHQRAAAGVYGYSSRSLARQDSALVGLERSQALLLDTVPYTLSGQTRLLMGLEYTGTLGLAQIRLQLPNGTILTSNTVNGTTQVYTAENDLEGGALMFVLQNAAPGMYQLLIDSPPADYTANALELNQMPTGTITSNQCSGPVVVGVLVTCNGIGPGISQASMSWNAADVDSPGSTVDAGYVQVINNAIDNTTFTVLEAGKPLGAGTLNWNLNEVPSGRYRMAIEIANTSGPPVRVYGNQLIQLTDTRAPAMPTGLIATALANELSLRWTQNTERDLVGYEVGLGVVVPNQADSVANFFYTRHMGPKDVIVNTNSLVDGKVWGIPDNVEVFYGIRSYDASGNYSSWTALKRGKPWAVAPATWTPVPSGVGTHLVEVAFSTPMKSDTFTNSLQVRDASGALVAGATYLLTNDSLDQIIGIGFDPTVFVEGQFTATLKGGPAGVQAVDGRTMGGDYSWSFTLDPFTVALPLVQR